ncbi:type II secretion system F family protein [Candidatus Woesebacteria bacterium]|nr:type II secretion system F family protein [Candidatus Woesebacteria bacterium]
MPFFRYTVKNDQNQTIKGKIEAKSERSAAALLHERKLFVVDVRPLGDELMLHINSALFGVKSSDVVLFTRQLSTMISAGLPLANGLAILSQQSKPDMARLVGSILQDIEGGLTFADALAKHPKEFGSMFIQLIRAGEIGGVLDDVLGRLADNMEKSSQFRAKTKGALIYPVIVIIAMLVVGAIMMIFVIPKMTALYKDFDAELPMMTQLLIGSSDFFVRFWWVIGGIVFAAVTAFAKWKKTDGGRHSYDRMMLRLPLFGPLIEKIALTEFTRTLALLLNSGVSLLEALEIVTKGVDNIVYQDALQECAKQVEKGVSLSQALTRFAEFPPILQQMVAVGEETGRLDEVLRKLSVYFEQESEQAVKNMTAAIEPMIMVVLGVGVGAMVIAVIMPIYNLTSQF